MEGWMNVPITFPPVLAEDISEEPIIVKAEVEGYLVRFAGKVIKPLGKIELEVSFGNEGMCRKTSMKLTVIKAPSPYNIILGRSGLKTLRAIPSTIHSMMKFPTPKGVATLVTRSIIISECLRLGKKRILDKEEEPAKVKDDKNKM
ncbi:hypothetical protein Tco_0833663 [Tanacetum coccineum]